ncbi:MAG: hypothetical protein H0T72_14905 [Chloroflexia bacterium]|nr:hypothetical protein [Chloroflexia bacterium]
MTWRNLFRKPINEQDTEAMSAEVKPAAPNRGVPAHLAQAIEKRSAGGPSPNQDPEQRKLAGLRRRRVAILFDIEQGELAASPDNPWTQRIALLGEAMTNVGDDLVEASKVEPGPNHPVPATPIAIGAIDSGDAASVAFSIGANPFLYSEDPDWAERGHQIARSELVRRSGEVDALVPDDTREELREPLRAHLGDSLFVMASDLRDRMLDGEPLPPSPSLADHAAPCPVCGGWTDWRGTCQNCARRNARIMELKREEGRLLDERSREGEERRRLIEGLPLARKRLRDVEADLARLGETFR